MKRNPFLMKAVNLLIVSFVLLSSCHPLDEEKYYEEGVSKFLAIYRNATISQVNYELAFVIPDSKDEPIAANATIEFRLNSKRAPVVLDFRVPENYLESVTANGKKISPEISRGHIIITRRYLHRRYNNIRIKFRAGDMSLNRNDEYLYTLFVPDRASTAFPCFDQPDIKACFSLTLEMPAVYEAMSNSPVLNIDTAGNKKVVRFAVTHPISTYLFAFAAGKFERIDKEINGVKMEMLHRETRPEYITNNVDEIFRLHYNSLKWLEKYTLIPYPFEKVGFVLIPSFQYSGMEHPGSVFYRATGLLLEASPTLNEKLSRASLIAHETSHIWFGDLVTMKWFDDVWLKEVFAGFMSDKIVNPDFPDVNHNLRFLLSRFPPAYAIDRTKGANPIIQQLDNMKDAGSLYGGIIYNKAPVVMKHLEVITGEEGLQKGLQHYLSKYSFSNARWDDLIAILEGKTSKKLEEWSRIWVKEAGMPIITTIIEKSEKGYKISFSETDPAGNIRHWPQDLSSMVITPTDSVTLKCTPGDKNSSIKTIDEPICVIPDLYGTAYGTFIYDSITLSFLAHHINDFNDPVLRGTLWINLNEDLINHVVLPLTFYSMLSEALLKEPDVQLRNYLIGRFTSTFWDYLSDEQREKNALTAEGIAWNKMLETSDPSQARTWFNMYRNVALTETGIANLRIIWNKGELPGGLKLSEDELSALALNLALKGCPDAPQVLGLQRERITGKDRLQRFDFITPAVSKDQGVRDAFFESLRDPVNREHEPWVLEALAYLHHPLMAHSSVKYILPSLEMLEEIKSTGDIFFPGSWISTTLAGHHSSEASDIVKKFLDDHPDYPHDLRLKILQAGDHLFRIKEE